MKCPECKSCFEVIILNNTRYLYCWLCNKFYFYDAEKEELVDKTEEARKYL